MPLLYTVKKLLNVGTLNLKSRQDDYNNTFPFKYICGININTKSFKFFEGRIKGWNIFARIESIIISNFKLAFKKKIGKMC